MRLACLLGFGLLACGARTGLSGADGADSGGAGGGGAGGDGGGAIDCPVRSFIGDQSGGVRIALDDRHGFWSTRGGRIERGDLETGEVVELADVGVDSGFGSALAIDGSYVYGATSTTLFRVPKEGGPAETLASGSFIAVDLVVSESRVLLLTRGTLTDGQLWMWTASDGMRLAWNGFSFPTAVRVLGNAAYVTSEGALVDGEWVFAGMVTRTDLMNGNTSLVAGGLDGVLSDPFGLDIDNADLIVGDWPALTNEYGSRVVRVPQTGGAPIAAFEISDTSLPVAMALDGRTALVTVPRFAEGSDLDDSTLLGVSVDDGTTSELLGPIDGFLTVPAANTKHIAVTVQPFGDQATVEANVVLLCKN